MSTRLVQLLAILLMTPLGLVNVVESAEQVADGLMIDDMEDSSKNSLGGRNAIFMQAPSRAAFSKSADYGKTGSGLKLVYDKKNEGGPRGDGGFCGFYTILKRGPDGYLDGSGYKAISFWVRGEKGGEKFKLGVSDKMYETMDDSVKTQDVSVYLPAGKITAEWQQAIIPVGEVFIDWKLLNSISFCFEGDLYQNGADSGTVYIDELMLIKDPPASSTPARPAGQ